MNKHYELVIVIPIGPDAREEFITDTINSIRHFVECNYKIILIDDSHKGTGVKIKHTFPSADLLTTPRNYGRLCGLYITLCQAYAYALETYSFKALLKIDTDALVIGYNPQQQAFDLFKKWPGIGIAGQYPFDYYGKPWDTGWPAWSLKREIRKRNFLKKPLVTWKLKKLYEKAVRNEYRPGESVFGGSYFMSEAYVRKMYLSGLLPDFSFEKVDLEEDHLMSLLAKATGFNLGDLSSGKLPFGCAWRGLPDSPQNLQASGKKIIHSTRFWNEMNEQEIRNYFKERRQHSFQQAQGMINL